MSGWEGSKEAFEHALQHPAGESLEAGGITFGEQFRDASCWLNRDFEVRWTLVYVISLLPSLRMRLPLRP